MRMRRQAGALILYGGWLLLFNPEANRPDAPLSSWKKRGEYDTGYVCEQARSKSVADLLRDQRQSPDTPACGPLRPSCAIAASAPSASSRSSRADARPQASASRPRAARALQQPPGMAQALPPLAL